MTNYYTMTVKALAALVSVSRGNKKLIPDKLHKFIIFNLPAVLTCPFRTPHCEKFCYARKAETAYPDCLPARKRNLKATLSPDFVDIMTAYIRRVMSGKAYRNAKSVVVRIHESGDFYSQEYFNKWLAIANNCADIQNLQFMAYTKSLPFVHDIPDNMTLRSSIWDDTTPEMVAMTAEKNLPIYTAVDKFTDEPEENRCGCENCATCRKCWAAVKTLLCEIH